MRLLRTLVFTFFALPCALAAPQNQTTRTAILPPVTTYALDRAKVTVPADFTAPLNLLILSFQRDQQSVVDSWLSVTPSESPGVQTWWLPIEPRANGLYRWWMNASLRTSLPPSQPRRYTVPLYVDKPRFLMALQVSSEQEVVVLLTDRTGHVLWRTSGPVSDSKKGGLTGFVTRFGR
jgi:hypothetical protein